MYWRGREIGEKMPAKRRELGGGPGLFLRGSLGGGKVKLRHPYNKRNIGTMPPDEWETLRLQALRKKGGEAKLTLPLLSIIIGEPRSEGGRVLKNVKLTNI